MDFTRPAALALPIHPRHGFSLFWLAALAAVTCLPARAQDNNNRIDPPGRVARLSLAEGAISFSPAPAPGDSSDVWTAAPLNRPLTAGDRLWVGPQARGELHIGSTALHLDKATSVDLIKLDDDNAQLRLGQGSVRLRVRELPPGQLLEVDTPNLAFVISQPGDYRVDVDPASNTTRVVVQQGSGLLYGAGGTPLAIGQQQQGSFTGTQLAPAAPGASVQDGFDAWALQRNQLEDQSVSARYVPRSVVGYQQLDSYGDWSHDATYGNVWLPRAVPAGWAPYRAGHWSWVAPWGWTWVDQAPWGFAPFHYGRWAQIGPRWAWVPGNFQSRPVYAPALVGFMGVNPGQASRNLPNPSARPGLGWFPLAPGEVFHPGYRASPRYVTSINNITTTSVNTQVNNNFIYRYQHQPTAVTAVPAGEFWHRRGEQGQFHTPSANELAHARMLPGGWADHQRPDGQGLPGRPDRNDRPVPPPAASLPPPVVQATRPVMPENNGQQPGRFDGRPGRFLPAQPGQIQPPAPPATAAPVMPAAPAAAPVRPMIAPAQVTPMPPAAVPTPPANRPLPRPVMTQPAPGQHGQPMSQRGLDPAQRPGTDHSHQQAQQARNATRHEQLHQQNEQARQQQRQQQQTQHEALRQEKAHQHEERLRQHQAAQQQRQQQRAQQVQPP